MLREALLCACLRAGGAHAGLRVRATSLHIGVPRSLRGSVPRDVQVRACVPRGSRVYLRACMPMPACLRACWGWSRLCACLRAGGVRADLCVRASERVDVCGPLFLYSLSLCLSLQDRSPTRPAPAVTLTGLHIDVTRSLRVSVPRDARVRARVPSGSQVHLRTCMPMPARAGARAEAGAPVRVLAYKGARLSLPLSASPRLCLSSVSLSLTRPQSYMDSPRATPTGRGGGQPPRPDPEPPRPAARAPRDKNASSVLTDLRRQPRGMPPRAPSGRLPRPATAAPPRHIHDTRMPCLP